MSAIATQNVEQPILELTSDESVEAEIERRVAARCQAEAFLWKFRLIVAETVMMGLLVCAAGIALNQSIGLIVRASLLVSGSCFASGILLLGLTGAWSRLRARIATRNRS
ncbi:MAG: hypothetical protein J0I80_08140 [Sphingomonas sp.]|nr:hypothetical protein [Sphingomonas sp.]